MRLPRVSAAEAHATSLMNWSDMKRSAQRREGGVAEDRPGSVK